MGSIIATATRTFASAHNHFWSAGSNAEYAVKIDASGVLRFQRGSGAWVAFDPQPPSRPTHVAADDNRVLVLTVDGELHWCCLSEDIASWVDYNFGVMEAYAGSDARFHRILDGLRSELGSLLDLDAMLGELYQVGDLFPDGRSSPPPRDRKVVEGVVTPIERPTITVADPGPVVLGPSTPILSLIPEDPD